MCPTRKKVQWSNEKILNLSITLDRIFRIRTAPQKYAIGFYFIAYSALRDYQTV